MLAGLLLWLLRRNALVPHNFKSFMMWLLFLSRFVRAGSFSNRSSRYVRFSESAGGVQKFENNGVYLTFRWDFWVFKPMPILAMCENVLPAFGDIGLRCSSYSAAAGSGSDDDHARNSIHTHRIVFCCSRFSHRVPKSNCFTIHTFFFFFEG